MIAVIKAIKSYLPPNKTTNEDLEREFPDWDIHKTFQNTGVAIRSIAEPGECASDLGVKAAEMLFADGICKPGDIDFLLFVTQFPDYFLPASSCIMQHRLGLPFSCGAMDINLGCSGFVYGLAVAKSLVEQELARNVLLITADTPSKAINPRDRGVRALFSDGASATLIGGAISDKEAIGPFVFGTDGRGAKNLIIPAGGWRLRPTPDTAMAQEDGTGNYRSLQDLYMDGAEIFNFSLQTVPEVVYRLLEKSGLGLSEIDYFVFHQANKFMLEALRRKLRIPREKFVIVLEKYGNTSSASIPMALEELMVHGQLREGMIIMMVGFGVGYSWAGAIMRI